MAVRGIALAAAALAWASSGGAADLSVAGSAPGGVAVVEPTPLEWLRYVHPREGREVTLAGGGVRTIEWRHPVEVRVRTESGAALTPRERAAIRELALVCRRGEVRDVTESTERNGTFVVEYGCAWLQGFEGR